MHTYLQSLRAHNGEAFWEIITYNWETQCAYNQAIHELLKMDEPPPYGWLPKEAQRSMDKESSPPTPEEQKGYDTAVFLSKLAIEEPICPVITAEFRAAEILEEARYEFYFHPNPINNDNPHYNAGYSLGVSFISQGLLPENSHQIVANYGETALLDKDDALPIRTDSESYLPLNMQAAELLSTFGWFDKKVPEECPSWEKDLRMGMIEGVEAYKALLKLVDDISDEENVTSMAQIIYSYDDSDDTWCWDDDWGAPVG